MADEIKTKKPIWKKWWLWVIIIFVVFIIIGGSGGEKKETNEQVQPSEQKFSFDDYIQKDKVREYEIIKEDDLSTKAVGKKNLSDYTLEELEKLPVNIKKEYRIVVPINITKEELESTMAKCIKDQVTQDKDIDEIVVFVYDSEEKVDGAYTLGKAKWCPSGEWSGVTSEIAKNNNRDSYKIVYSIKEETLQEIKKGPEVLYGLTENERKEIFTEIVKCEDWADLEAMKQYYPGCEYCSEFIIADINKYGDKMSSLRDSCITELIDEYNITEETRLAISTEGITKSWPLPESDSMPSCCNY